MGSRWLHLAEVVYYGARQSTISETDENALNSSIGEDTGRSHP